MSRSVRWAKKHWNDCVDDIQTKQRCGAPQKLNTSDKKIILSNSNGKRQRSLRKMRSNCLVIFMQINKCECFFSSLLTKKKRKTVCFKTIANYRNRANMKPYRLQKIPCLTKLNYQHRREFVDWLSEMVDDDFINFIF